MSYNKGATSRQILRIRTDISCGSNILFYQHNSYCSIETNPDACICTPFTPANHAAEYCIHILPTSVFFTLAPSLSLCSIQTLPPLIPSHRATPLSTTPFIPLPTTAPSPLPQTPPLSRNSRRPIRTPNGSRPRLRIFKASHIRVPSAYVERVRSRDINRNRKNRIRDLGPQLRRLVRSRAFLALGRLARKLWLLRRSLVILYTALCFGLGCAGLLVSIVESIRSVFVRCCGIHCSLLWHGR